MGEMTFIIGPTGSTRTRTRTITDAVFSARVIPALSAFYGQVKDTVMAPPRDRTSAELADCLFDTLEQLAKKIFREGETRIADSGVTDLPMT